MSNKRLEIPSKMMTLHLTERTSLYNAYMSFFPDGGVFVPTDEKFDMGEEVLLVLELMELADKLPIKTRVAWKSPVAKGNRPQGIGLVFQASDIGKRAKALIENNLAGLMDHPRPNYTM